MNTVPSGSSQASSSEAPARAWPSRMWDTLDERLGLSGLQYPVPEHANRLAYSLGGLSLVSFILLLGTGIYLTQYYAPDPVVAHESVHTIMTDVTLGGFIRSFHYWTAMAMVVLVGLHLLRVFISGSYKRPREGNWMIGVVLASITAMFFFTGTVLKWDQESFEALQHNIEIGKLLGRFGFWFSPSFGGIPLLHRLYSVHVTILPALFAMIVLVHLLLVKRHGMAPSPFRRGPTPEPVARFSRHLAHLVAFSLVLVGVVALLALLAPPAHGPAPVAGIEITKPPWPLLWIYPIENWVGVSGILWATIAIFIALLIVPFVDRSQERDPRRRLAVVIPATAFVVAIVAMIVFAAIQPVASHIGGG